MCIWCENLVRSRFLIARCCQLRLLYTSWLRIGAMKSCSLHGSRMQSLPWKVAVSMVSECWATWREKARGDKKRSSFAWKLVRTQFLTVTKEDQLYLKSREDSVPDCKSLPWKHILSPPHSWCSRYKRGWSCPLARDTKLQFLAQKFTLVKVIHSIQSVQSYNNWLVMGHLCYKNETVIHHCPVHPFVCAGAWSLRSKFELWLASMELSYKT